MKVNRTLYRILLILSFLAVNGLILFGIGAVWSYLNTGADRSAMLHVSEELSTDYLPKMIWDTSSYEGRPMETQTLKEIEHDYLKAWLVRNLALETNNPYGLADYYTDSARVKLYQILDLNKANSTTLKTTTLRHHPKLEFYSADGKMVVLTDKNVERYEKIYLEEKVLSNQKSTASYQVMLLLEDGFWRIRHMVEQASIEEDAASSLNNVPSVSSISEIRGINYYPQQTPWRMFGEQFNDSIIDTDFLRIQKLGLNTIRIFVPYGDFSEATTRNYRLERLQRTLDLAEKNSLKVMVTLFDFYGDYTIHNWTLTHRHAEQIVNALKYHKALLAWDIKNEPDLDFKTRGKERVMAWLGQMISEIKTWDSEHPVTIGWSNPVAAEHLSEMVDFVSFHYYLEPEDFSEAFAQLKTSVPDKPVLLQEYGYSSYNGLWNLYLGSEKDQATYLTQMQETLKAQDLPFMFWTLYDFETIPKAVVGSLPWRKGKQRHFGIIDKEGRPKKAYSVFGPTD
ncbi:glycoside hydrolase family 2 TIM barrel-domain containing protein [Ulvibacterium sp.]|uniref:glycoside hydrolase family 2 TIM barrel-domain containing protein n=1 Tax=Ulvibacterium sp. TaxID=2665914 RepID=UPI002615A3B8|nr:glycoside hydrolase family 2 TIM barrel-domain containing protein [Ulvibacterium sp.]